jgi:hypothetical protein
LLRVFGFTLGLGLLALGALAIGAHFALFYFRAGFPLDVEWMEGGMLLHAARLAAGQSIYAPPSIDFIPFLYTPLYPALLAALSKLLPLGYLLGRVVSILAFSGALGLLALAAAREVPARRSLAGLLALAMGVAAAGGAAGSFAFTGSFFDLVRADSLLLLLQALALFAAFLGYGLRSAALAGVAIALAFFTKQTAAVLGVALGLGLLVSSWRRALAYGAVAAALVAAGLLLLNLRSGGWFWRYVFELHQSHGFNARLAYVETPLRLFRYAAPVYLALAVAVSALALERRLRRRDTLHLFCAAGGVAAACIGFGTQWAFDNAFIPALYFPLFSLAVLGARLLPPIISRPRPAAAVAVAMVVCCLGLFVVRNALPDSRRFAPSAADQRAAAKFLGRLRALEGPLFVPFHPFYPVLVGQPPHLHRMGVLDVAARLGRPAGLDAAIQDGYFTHVILDWKSQPFEWPGLDERYHEVHRFTDGVDAVRAFSGAETSPRYLLARTVPPPQLPPGARRIAGFESGWDGFIPEGSAFPPAPPPALTGLFGKHAADSRSPGLAATGTLTSPPFTVTERRLRFTLAGPSDAGLRVLLLAGQEAVRSATPTGAAAAVEWEVSELSGKPLTLVIEDRSATAGLAVDEILAY